MPADLGAQQPSPVRMFWADQPLVWRKALLLH